MQVTAEEKRMLNEIEENAKVWRDRMEYVDEWMKIKDTRDEKNQQALDNLIEKTGRVKLPEMGYGFTGEIANGIRQNLEGIKSVGGRRSHSFEVKVGTMTTTGSVTGSVVRSYLEPSQKGTNTGVNMRDIVQIVPTSSGLVTLPRETGSTGSISRVPENTGKPQVDYSISMIDWRADYIAGYVRISKQLLQDMSFLQNWLPRLLMRDFLKAENTQLYGDLVAVATGNGTTSSTVYAEKLIDWLGNLMAAGYIPNSILSTSANWKTLMKTTSGAGGAYSTPGATVIGPDGAARIAGVPFFPTNFVTPDKTVVGDFTYATLAVADPLKIEFFEQDQDNVIKNLVTVRIEAREVLVIEQTDAFIVA